MKRFLLMCMMLFFSISSAVAATVPAELADAFAHLNAQPGFSCAFTQKLTFNDGSQHSYTGELAVLKPGRFRWRYIKPYEQLFVSDGSRIWHYEPDLMQVRILTHMDAVDPAIIRLLDGRTMVKDIVLLGVDKQNKRYHLRLHDGLKIWLGLDTHNSVAYVEGVDTLGNRNRIRLQQLIYQAPDAALFSFHIPQGVDIVQSNEVIK